MPSETTLLASVNDTQAEGVAGPDHCNVPMGLGDAFWLLSGKSLDEISALTAQRVRWRLVRGILVVS